MADILDSASSSKVMTKVFGIFRVPSVSRGYG